MERQDSKENMDDVLGSAKLDCRLLLCCPLVDSIVSASQEDWRIAIRLRRLCC